MEEQSALDYARQEIMRENLEDGVPLQTAQALDFLLLHGFVSARRHENTGDWLLKVTESGKQYLEENKDNLEIFKDV